MNHHQSTRSPSIVSHRLWQALAALAVFGAVLTGCEVQNEPEPDADESFGPATDARVGGAGGAGGGALDEGVPSCTGADDCADPTPVCRRAAGESGRCVQCLDSTFCPRSLPVCGLNDTCVARDPSQCREDFDCAAARPHCVLPGAEAVGVCVACAANADCTGGASRCSAAGTCVSSAAAVACTTDTACGPRRFCEDGACVF